MSSRLLVLHNGTRRAGAQHLIGRIEADGWDVETCWAYAGEFPDDLQAFRGMIVTGSPHGVHDDQAFIAPECRLLRDVAERGMPVLGLCFGSQILAAALCGMDQVFRRPFCEVGFKGLPLSDEGRGDPLLAGLGDPLSMLVWHNDEVRHDHADMRILASSDLCPNQIWRWRKTPVWGVQGHPELTPEMAPDWLEESRATFAKDGADTDALIRDSATGAGSIGLIDNFLAICRGNRDPHGSKRGERS